MGEMAFFLDYQSERYRERDYYDYKIPAEPCPRGCFYRDA